MYYVIGTSRFKQNNTKYIYHSQIAYPYGEFRKEIGFETLHKAELELDKVDKAVNRSPATRSIDLVDLTIEEHD